MSMKQLKVTPDIMAEEEAWVEEEIERELAALDLQQLEEENEEDTDAFVYKENLAEEDEDVPDSVKQYLERVQSKTEGLMRELGECDEILHYFNEVRTDEGSQLLAEIATEEGEDPATLKQRILAEIDKEDESSASEESGHSGLTDLPNTDQESIKESGQTDQSSNAEFDHTQKNSVDQIEHSCSESDQGMVNGTGETDEHPNKDLDQAVVSDNGHTDQSISAYGQQGVNDIDNVNSISQNEKSTRVEESEALSLVLVEESSRLEQAGRKQMQEIDKHMKERLSQIQQEAEKKRQEEETREKEHKEERMKLQRKMEEEQLHLVEDQRTSQKALEEQLAEEKTKQEEAERKFKAEMKKLEEETKREQEKYQRERAEEEKRQSLLREHAATKIQAGYRGARVKSKYGPELLLKKEERKKRLQEERLRIVEEERRKKEEEKRRKEEEERRKKEEEEARKRKLEEERKRKEEEERQRKAEEERNKKEEEERKRREEEEERKREEEEERKRKEEVERKRKEEEERKRKEEERRRQEEEEKKRREEEEKAKKAAEEQRRREEEERRRQEEAEAKRRKEEEEKRLAELELQRLAEEKRKKEEEEARLRALPDPIEKHRLEWIQNCKPWSKIVSEKKSSRKRSSKKPPRRPASAKNMLPITEEIILKAARVESLKKVTTVELRDLPGYSVAPLGQCVHLKAISIRNSQLPLLDGWHNCKKLHYIDLHGNKLEYVDLKDLESLLYLDLSLNSLTSIHGLDNCKKLQHLDVSHNKISRLGGLESLASLHSLDLSHNQLLNTRGLSDSPSIQLLDLSHNHLQDVTELTNLGLLKRLSVAGNTLQGPPELSNHVLLQELVLSDNSITTLESLQDKWLPLLGYLDIAQNSLTHLSPLPSCLLLQHLDVSNNQIEDVESLLPGLASHGLLETLTLEGNPVMEEAECTSSITTTCCTLMKLDGQNLTRPPGGQPQHHSDFHKMSIAQSVAWKTLTDSYKQGIESLMKDPHKNLQKVLKLHRNYWYQSSSLSVEHRYAHEYGETSPSTHNAPAALPVDDDEEEESNEEDVTSDKTNTFKKSERDNSIDKVESGNAVDEEIILTDGSGQCKGEGDSRNLKVKESQKTEKQGLSSANLVNTVDGAERSSKEIVDDDVNNVSIKKDSTKAKDMPQSSGLRNRDHSILVKREASATARERTNKKNVSLKSDVAEAEASPGPLVARKDTIDEGVDGRRGSTGLTVADLGGLLHREKNSQLQHVAATRIQATWRGHRVRRELDYHTTRWLCAVTIQAAWRGHLARVYANHLRRQRWDEEQRHLLPLHAAATKIQALWRGNNLRKRLAVALAFSKVEDDDDDFNYEEVDLGDFDFNEADIEKGWIPPDTPQLPTKTPVIGGINSKPPAARVPPLRFTPQPPNQPKQAWRHPESPMSDRSHPHGKPPRAPSAAPSGADTHRTVLSKKEEKLTEEWGFKDTHTAELMMRRAKKLKYNTENKKKISKLDPHQRLALFKKLEESTKLSAVRPPARKHPARKEYFTARKEEERTQEVEKVEEHGTRVRRTFEWVHTQVGDYDVATSRIMKSEKLGGSDSNLPRMDPDILAGGRTQLMQSPVSLELQSVDGSTNTRDDTSRSRSRRHSIDESPSGSAASKVNIQLPPIKTNSAPAGRTKERLSHRDSEVRLSGGWGGGRRKKSSKH